MKILLLLITVICANRVWGATRSWDDPPRPFEMFMYKKKENIGPHNTTKWYYVISQFDPTQIHFQDRTLGWEEVTPASVWEWINSPFTVVYLPWDWKDAERLGMLPDTSPAYTAPSYYPPATSLKE